MKRFRSRVFLLSAGILASTLTILLTRPVSAFDPNSANPFGDGIVNKVNVDSDAGKVITNFDYEVSLRNAIELKDGNILLSGHMKESWDESNCNSTRSKAILVKLSPKGRLVTNFANGGIFTYERLDRDEFGQTIEDFAGSIYVIGRSIDYDLADTDLTDGCDIQNSNPVILKLNANGSLNSTFGSDGSVTSISGINDLTAIALSGERLIISSMLHPKGILFALNKMTGSVDNTFGVDGNGKIEFSGNNIRQISQILVADKIYLIGDKFVESDPISECRGNLAALQWAINAVTLDGGPVNYFIERACGTSYSNGYKEGAYGTAFYREGSIYIIDGILKTLSGPNIDRYDTKLLKLDSFGNIDSSYSKLLDSYLIDQPFSLNRTSYAVQSRTMDRDGRIIISYNYNSDANAIVRIDENGIPDPDFGYQGKIKFGAVPLLLSLKNGTVFAFVNYASNPTSSLYVYNIETIRAKRKPVWSDYQRRYDGFTVTISNYSPEFTYNLSLEGRGKIQFNNGKVIVTDMRTGGDESTLKVLTSRVGFRTDTSTFRGRSGGVNSIRFEGLPTLRLNGAQLTCSFSGYVVRIIDGDEYPAFNETKIQVSIIDEEAKEIAASSIGQTSISIDLSIQPPRKYFYCSVQVVDSNGVKVRTDSLQGPIAKDAKSKYDLEIVNLDKSFLKQKRDVEQSRAMELDRARETWRSTIDLSMSKLSESKVQLENLFKLGKIKSSEYNYRVRQLNSEHRKVVLTSTKTYEQEKKSILEKYEIISVELSNEMSIKKIEMKEKFWIDLMNQGLVVTR